MTETERLQFDDTGYPALIALARQCLDEKAITAALDHVQKAIASNPSRPEAFNLLGVCCEWLRAFLEAQKYYRAALALDPAYVPAQRNLHRLVGYAKRGQVDLGGSGC